MQSLPPEPPAAARGDRQTPRNEPACLSLAHIRGRSAHQAPESPGRSRSRLLARRRRPVSGQAPRSARTDTPVEHDAEPTPAHGNPDPHPPHPIAMMSFHPAPLYIRASVKNRKRESREHYSLFDRRLRGSSAFLAARCIPGHSAHAHGFSRPVLSALPHGFLPRRPSSPSTSDSLFSALLSLLCLFSVLFVSFVLFVVNPSLCLSRPSVSVVLPVDLPPTL